MRELDNDPGLFFEDDAFRGTRMRHTKSKEESRDH